MVTGQTISRGDVSRFVGTVSVEIRHEGNDKHRVADLVPAFIAYGFLPEYQARVPRLEFCDNPRRTRRKEYEVTPRGDSLPDYHLEIENSGSAMTILTDLDDLGGVFSVLAFWATDGDSLAFLGFADTTLGSQFGRTTFGGWATLPDSSFVILMRLQCGDFGQAWGSFDFCRYSPPSNHLSRFHSETYDVEYFGDYTTLECALVMRSDSPVARLVHARFQAVPKPGEFPDHEFVQSDTSYVDLWDRAVSVLGLEDRER
jgi:hypothetical protein